MHTECRHVCRSTKEPASSPGFPGRRRHSTAPESLSMGWITVPDASRHAGACCANVVVTWQERAAEERLADGAKYGAGAVLGLAALDVLEPARDDGANLVGVPANTRRTRVMERERAG